MKRRTRNYIRITSYNVCYTKLLRFDFTGDDPGRATVRIRDGKLEVERGLVGAADLTVTADGATWVGFVRGERSLVAALLTRRIRLKGPARLLRAFGRCFPS